MKNKKTFWRLEDPEIDKKTKKVIKGGMFQHQREIWNAKNFIRLLVGGYGSGKTLLAAKRAISLALHNAPVPILVVSPSYRVCKRTIMAQIKYLLDGRKIKYKHNIQNQEIIIYYKNLQGIIWFGSGDNPDLLKGPNVGAAIIDEPFIQSVEVFNQLLARIRHPASKHLELLLTGTPENLNWGYEIAKNNENKYDIKVVHAATFDNKALPEQFIKQIKSAYDEKLAEAYLLGKFVNLSTGTIYYNFDFNENVQDIKYDGESELMVGIDFNVNPMSAVIFYEKNNTVYILEEIQLPNANTELMAQTLREKIENYNKSYINNQIKCYPDPAGRQRKTSAPVGQTDLTILQYNKFTIYAPNKTNSNKDCINAVNKLLGEKRLIINNKCKNLIKSLEQLDWENLNKQQDLTHLADALKYPISYRHPINRPITPQMTYVDI